MCRRIKIKRVQCLDINRKKTQLAVFRLTLPDGSPFNYVWIFGNTEKAKQKLFYLGKTGFVQTDLGIKYGAKAPTVSYRIEISNPDLKGLCRDFKIRSILIIRFNTY